MKDVCMQGMIRMAMMVVVLLLLLLLLLVMMMMNESRRQDSGRIRKGRKEGFGRGSCSHNLKNGGGRKRGRHKRGSARGVSQSRLAPSFPNSFFIFSLITICSPVLPITTVLVPYLGLLIQAASPSLSPYFRTRPFQQT